LIPNRGVRLHEVSDGLSHSVVAGECSDFIYDQAGLPNRIDGGHRMGGWLMGTAASETPPLYSPPLSAWNITTIRYLPNSEFYNRPGIDTDNGPNNPLNSAHVNGVNALMLDGAVSFVDSDVELNLLKQLATRDDGHLEISIAK
jgi:prepilin-type processing-associated H-X9-DG protein